MPMTEQPDRSSSQRADAHTAEELGAVVLVPEPIPGSDEPVPVETTVEGDRVRIVARVPDRYDPLVRVWTSS